MIRLKFLFLLLPLLFALAGCTPNDTIDVNIAVPDNSWMYAKSLKTRLVIADSTQAYHLSFKVRNTADYRYSNLYVVMRLKGNGLTKTVRYQFKITKPDGQWIGKGSGDLYINTFTLLSNYRFAKAGTYELEIEQNMRDNPLIGISDIGVILAKQL